MRRFVAQLNDGSYINIFADSMKLEKDLITVYNQGALVAVLDISVVLMACLWEGMDTK